MIFDCISSRTQINIPNRPELIFSNISLITKNSRFFFKSFYFIFLLGKTEITIIFYFIRIVLSRNKLVSSNSRLFLPKTHSIQFLCCTLEVLVIANHIDILLAFPETSHRAASKVLNRLRQEDWLTKTNTSLIWMVDFDGEGVDRAKRAGTEGWEGYNYG